jgi:cyclopropane-fatty-acyl-phospholipid synthase
MHTSSFRIIESLAASADININGSRPWDLQVHDDRLFDRILKYKGLGLGEAYMDRWWDAEQVDELIFRVLTTQLDVQLKGMKQFWLPLLSIKIRTLPSVFLNLQTRARAAKAGQWHYDIGNELFQYMLGDNLNYTCGYWKDAKTLEEAQVAKMDLVCRKLQLEPGMSMLDIGCGWGSLAKHAAMHYGVSVVGVTISREQQKLAEERCSGLPIEIRLQDYRDIDEKFDRIASVGMFEHVGYKNQARFMSVASSCLVEDGLILLHTIGSMDSLRHSDPWLGRYIFPNSLIPSIAQIGRAVEPYFILEDWHSLGTDYAKTLLAWHRNFQKHWPKIEANYSDRFYRMWEYYLLSSAGGFKAKTNQLWQIVLAKPGRLQTYSSIR